MLVVYVSICNRNPQKLTDIQKSIALVKKLRVSRQDSGTENLPYKPHSIVKSKGTCTCQDVFTLYQC